MEKWSNLDDPDHAAHAWGRYRRIMLWMTMVSLATAATVLAVLWWWLDGQMPVVMIVWIGLGVFLTVLLAAALMGLVFLSSGTGHDSAIHDFSRDEVDSHWRE